MYPIHYKFKRIALANKLMVTDSGGQQLFYAHQKMLKLKEKIIVYADSSKSNVIGELNADRVIDFSPLFTFTDTTGRIISSIKRQGRKSIWRAHYAVMGADEQVVFTIREANVWVKVADTFMNQIPGLALVSGYFFNPTYNVIDTDGQVVAKIIKQRSFFEAAYDLVCDSPQTTDPNNILPISILAMLTRERLRG